MDHSFVKMIMYLTHFNFPHSGGVMIYFDRIEVVNMLVPSAGTTRSYCKSPSFGWNIACASCSTLNNCCICSFVCSGGNCEELHSRLWQNSHFQQNSPWTQPVLQRAHITGSLHRAVWWVCSRSKQSVLFHCDAIHRSATRALCSFLKCDAKDVEYSNSCCFLFFRHHRWEPEGCFAERTYYYGTWAYNSGIQMHAIIPWVAHYTHWVSILF